MSLNSYILSKPNVGVIATFTPPKPILNRPGLDIFHTTTTPKYPNLSGRAKEPVDTLIAKIDLNKLKIIPSINSKIEHGIFYTKDLDSKNMNIFEHKESIREKFNLSSEPILLTSGNSNLFNNIGYWAATKDKYNTTNITGIFSHFQEYLEGLQNALIIKNDNSVEIKAVYTNTILQDASVEAALGGGILIKDGKLLSLEEDNGTSRPTYIDLSGDIQHFFEKKSFNKEQELVIKKLSLEQTDKLLDISNLSSPQSFMQFFNSWYGSTPYLYKRKNYLPSELKLLLNGQNILIQGKHYGPFPRSTFNHLFAATTTNPKELFIFGTFDPDKPQGDKTRKGLLFEDTALLGMEFAKLLFNSNLKYALALCNGSEPIIWSDSFSIHSYEGLNRPLTSTLLFFQIE